MYFEEKKPTIIDKPEKHFIESSFLPECLFRELNNSFPGDNIYEGDEIIRFAAGREDITFGMDAYKLLVTNEAWRYFTHTIQSQRYAEWLLDTFQEMIDIGRIKYASEYTISSGCTSGLGVYKHIPNQARRLVFQIRFRLLGRFFPDNYYINLAISRQQPGYKQRPHFDTRDRKIVSLLYFNRVEAIDECEENGYLKFYDNICFHCDRYKNKEVYALPTDCLQLYQTIVPKENLYVSFKNSARMFHEATEFNGDLLERRFAYIALTKL